MDEVNSKPAFSLRSATNDQRPHFNIPQPVQPQMDADDEEFSDDDENEKRKQMTYGELVRKFSMHNEKIQLAYYAAKARLERSFDYNQFVKCRK